MTQIGVASTTLESVLLPHLERDAKGLVAAMESLAGLANLKLAPQASSNIVQLRGGNPLRSTFQSLQSLAANATKNAKTSVVSQSALVSRTLADNDRGKAFAETVSGLTRAANADDDSSLETVLGALGRSLQVDHPAMPKQDRAAIVARIKSIRHAFGLVDSWPRNTALAGLGMLDRAFNKGSVDRISSQDAGRLIKAGSKFAADPVLSSTSASSITIAKRFAVVGRQSTDRGRTI